MVEFVRGDTKDFKTKFQIKGTETFKDLSIYDEIEVQFNQQSFYQSIKKLKSKGEVEVIEVEGVYYLLYHLSQEDTFSLNEGIVERQFRFYVDNDCKGTLVDNVEAKKVLSNKVLGGDSNE